MTKTVAVMLKKIPEGSRRMAVKDRRGTAYEVWVGGTYVGRVEEQSVESYRSEGTGSRWRYGFRGFSRDWSLMGADGMTSWERTRKGAIKTLLELYCPKISDGSND